MTAAIGSPTTGSSGLRPAADIAATRSADSRESRRPLFLGATLRARVDADGPALRVRAERRAETRFPLDRVSRVVASARVSWSAEALRACLESAIPIVIVGNDGLPLGSVQPARLPASSLAAALEELLDWPDWRDVYGCWLRAARMRVLADWQRARQAKSAPLDPRAYQELVKTHVYCARPTTHKMSGLWRGAIYALATATAVRWGLPPVMWGFGGDSPDLRRDLADLMELRLRLEVYQEMEAALKDEATMLFVFHALTEKLEFEAGRAVRSLARRVNEVLVEWR
jgi:hypothetical protein